MSLDLKNSSVVQWFEGAEKHHCGYCKNRSSISYGMWAEKLTVDDYQDLIDRGWRRSGKYCYKPIMDKTCCPLYTIKCDAVNFCLSKSQKKIIKKFNKFLKDDLLTNKDSSDNQNFDELASCSVGPTEIPNIDLATVHSNSNITDCIETTSAASEEASTSNTHEKNESLMEEVGCKNLSDTRKICGQGADPNKLPCKKAKLLRIERKKEKALKKGMSLEKPSAIQTPKGLREFLEEAISDECKNQLRICLIPTSIPDSKWQSVEKIEFELYKKYQTIIHDDPPEKLTMNGFNRFLVKSPLEISLVRMSSSNNMFSTSAELYKKYQMKIHNDPPHECSAEQFYSFLVESPLQPKSFHDSIEGAGYGSFHQQYWINDKLIAVGVIDILPKCISSVYFFYDPDYRSLTLGTYGSMREIELTQQLQSRLPDLKNYYMGFYVHTCSKMRYKGKLVPSFLLCPETYSWTRIEKCVPLLEVNKYSRLNDDIDAIDHNRPSEEDILRIKIVYNFRLKRLSDYILLFNEELEKYRVIGNLIGKECSNKLVFWEK